MCQTQSSDTANILSQGSSVYVALKTGGCLKGRVAFAPCDNDVLALLVIERHNEDEVLGEQIYLIPWHAISYIRPYIGRL